MTDDEVEAVDVVVEVVDSAVEEPIVVAADDTAVAPVTATDDGCDVDEVAVMLDPVDDVVDVVDDVTDTAGTTGITPGSSVNTSGLPVAVEDGTGTAVTTTAQ